LLTSYKKQEKTQKIIPKAKKLSIIYLGASKIGLAFGLGLDEVVTVDGRGDGDLGDASGNELEQGHLGGGVLASNAVRAELQVRLAADNVLVLGVVQVTVDDLLGEGEGLVDAA